MHALNATFRIRWTARILGLVVLALCLAGTALMLAEGGGLLGWTLVAGFGTASLLASIANLGDRYDTDETGLSYRNVLTGALGWPRARRASWADIHSAVEQDGSTIFLDVGGQGRWVLDQLDGQEQLRLILTDRGIAPTQRSRPRLAMASLGLRRRGICAPGTGSRCA